MKQITKGVLRKLVAEEIEKQRKLRETNTVAANPGMSYNTPRFLKKKDNEH